MSDCNTFTDDAKALATMQARFALAGYQLDQLAYEGDERVLVVSRWGLSRQLDSMSKAVAFLEQVAERTS